MDVFVLIDQDSGTPSVVLGAATHLGAAMDIADRSRVGRQVDHEPWTHYPEIGMWKRRQDGVWQEIVRVPLAGAGKPAVMHFDPAPDDGAFARGMQVATDELRRQGWGPR